MIDLNLCVAYTRISDGKLFLTRRITKGDYVLYDPETGEKSDTTSYHIRSKFIIVEDSYRTLRKRQARVWRGKMIEGIKLASITRKGISA